MEIKCGRKVYNLNEKDRILDNGACYQIITREKSSIDRTSPVIAKSTFKKLVKENKLILAEEKYKTFLLTELGLYKINPESKDVQR